MGKAAYVDSPTTSNSQRTPCAPFYLRPTPASRPLPHRALPVAAVPHLHHTIPPGRRHVPPARARVDGDARNGPEMREQLYRGVRKVRRPERHATVLVAEVDDGVVQVLCHGATGAELCAVLDEELTCRGVLVFQVASVALRLL